MSSETNIQDSSGFDSLQGPLLADNMDKCRPGLSPSTLQSSSSIPANYVLGYSLHIPMLSPGHATQTLYCSLYKYHLGVLQHTHTISNADTKKKKTLQKIFLVFTGTAAQYRKLERSERNAKYYVSLKWLKFVQYLSCVQHLALGYLIQTPYSWKSYVATCEVQQWNCHSWVKL